MRNDQSDKPLQIVQWVDIHSGTPGLDHSKITDPEEIAALKAGTLAFLKLVYKKMAEKKKRKEEETGNDE